MTVNITRRGLMGGIGIAAAAAPFGTLRAQTSPTASFMAIGDWGRRGEPHQQAVADAMGKLATKIGSRFTLALGDNFYVSGVQSVDDTHWRESFEHVYTAPSLQHRWYAILGNHDYRGNPQAQVDYSRKSDRWTMPGRYYVVPGANVGMPDTDLFMIDTSPMLASYRKEPADSADHHVHDQNPDAQYAWLDRVLGESKARWKLVYGHHPVFSGGEHGDTTELIARLLPIMTRHKVQVYACGHDHDMQHIRRAGMHFIATGCGSQIRPVGSVEGTQFFMSCSGFSLWRVGAEQLDFAFYDWAGAKIYETSITSDGGVVAPAKRKKGAAGPAEND